ncbi:MAG: potassium channel family protein [Planctomycetota bacterium]|jgi:hypothetical protein
MNAHADPSAASPQNESKYLFLLIALIAFVLLLPLQRELGYESGLVLTVLMTAVLVSGVQAVCHNRKLKIIGTSIWILVFALSASSKYVEPSSPLWQSLEATGDLVAVFGFGALTIFILQDVFMGEISRDRLRGAAAAYLLMGIAFGLIFKLIDVSFPGSFNLSAEDTIASLEANFYSFVTLTTLGYGDITPVRPFAQAVAYLESCIGQFYLTVLVAFLVGKRLAAITSNSAKT